MRKEYVYLLSDKLVQNSHHENILFKYTKDVMLDK